MNEISSPPNSSTQSKTIIAGVGTTSLSLHVSCNGLKPVNALLDCGANINIITSSYYSSISSSLPPNHECLDYPPIHIETITGGSINVIKAIRIQLSINTMMISTLITFLVVDQFLNIDTVLLGMNFINDHVNIIDLTSRRITLKEYPHHPISFVENMKSSNIHNAIPSSTPTSIDSKCESIVDETVLRVQLIRSLKVPPKSSVHIPVRICASGCVTQTPVNVSFLYEPDGVMLRDNDVHASISLVQPRSNVVTIEIINNSPKSMRYQAASIVGYLTKVKIEEHPLLLNSIMHVKDYPSKQTSLKEREEFDRELESAIKGDKSSLTIDQQKQLTDLIVKNRNAFNIYTTLRTTSVAQHCIDTGSHLPIATPPYRVPPAHREEIERHVSQMLENNVIEPSDSPWASPVLLVKKPDNNYRFCIDYRKLNAITKRDVYPLPRIDDTLDELGTAMIFSTLDLESGFWQIPVHTEDRAKTAFNTPHGHYQFKVLPFGLTNAPSTFQRVMNGVLRKHKRYCLVYIDDIIIFSKNFLEHLTHLQLIFDSIVEAGLTIKMKKCKIAQDEVKFLGHLVSHQTVKPDPQKILAVRSFPAPKTVSELQSFLGLVGYYRRFVPRLASVAQPLYKLLMKGVRWIWGVTQQQSFQELKHSLTSSPILTLPDFTQPFCLQTDASGTGIGAVLAQVIDGKERVISYASKTLNDAQRRYNTTEREALAVVWSVKLFRPYLLGRHFTIHTDHEPLKGQFKNKDTSSRLMRMVLSLQDYEYEIIYRSGRQNANADTMSRLPAFLESRNNSDNKVHYLVAAVTRSNTHSLPVTRRNGIDPDLALDPDAYNLDRAIKESQVLDMNASDVKEQQEENNLVDESHGYDIEGEGEDMNDVIVETDNMINEEKMSDIDVGASPSIQEDLSEMNVQTLQRQDEELRPIIQELERGESSKDRTSANPPADYHPAYTLKNGTLYYNTGHHTTNASLPENEIKSTDDNPIKLVVPKALQASLLKEYHDGSGGAHLAYSKTYEKIKLKYYWSHMTIDIKKYIATCHKCETKKSVQSYRNVPIGSLPIPSRPFESLGIDILGPLPETETRHNKYILVIVDHLTRWPFAFPLTNARAKTIANVLVERVFLEHGFPATLLSDRGSNFLSELMLAVLHIFKVRKLSTSAYHPQTNGMTERFNKTLTTMLAHYVNQYQKDWDRYLPYVLYAYRTAPHAVTKYSPFYLLYGREAIYPFDLLVHDASETNVESLCEDNRVRNYITGLVTKLGIAHNSVIRGAEEARRIREDTNSTMYNIPHYAVGSQVLLYTPTVKPKTVKKLTALWTGPFQVLEMLSNKLNYRIQRVNKNGQIVRTAKSLLVHVSRLKRYYHPNTSPIRSTW